MNICQRLLGDYNLSRLYNSYIIESDDIGQALYEVGEFLTKSIFEGENLSITDAALDRTTPDLNPNHLQNFPDFFLVQKEDVKTKNISIEQIHELQKFLNKSSVISGFKIGVIYEAELMTEKAENACLKILEDTPRNSLIILITTNATLILPTIKSRCAKICFRSHPSSSLEINELHLNVLNKNIAIKERIDFIQTFLSKDRKKWLVFAKDVQKLIAKFLKHSLSPKAYALSKLEQEILDQLKYIDINYLESKYSQIDTIIDKTTRLDLDLRVSATMILSLIH